MIWLCSGFHGDDQINKLRTMRNLFRSCLFKQQKEGKGTNRREKNIIKRTKEETASCWIERKKNKNKLATKRRKRTKEETASCLIEKKRKNKDKPATKRVKRKRRKKETVSELLCSNNFYLSVNIWVRKRGFKLMIMVKALVLMTRAFLEG